MVRHQPDKLPYRSLVLPLLLLFTGLPYVGCSVGERIPDPGFQPHHVLAMDVRPGLQSDHRKLTEFYSYAAHGLGQLPGVVAASACDALPTDPPRKAVIVLKDQPPAAKPIVVNCYKVLPGYLQTMVIPLLKGRDFIDRDTDDPVGAIVSEAFARKNFPEQEPIGKSLKIGGSSWLTVVGVAGDVGWEYEREPACFCRFPRILQTGRCSSFASAQIIPVNSPPPLGTL